MEKGVLLVRFARYFFFNNLKDERDVNEQGKLTTYL